MPDLTGYLETFAMNPIVLNVQDMTCGACVKHVSAALNSLTGVTHVEVDLASALVHVNGSADAQTLIAALANAGYSAQMAEARTDCAAPTQTPSKGGCCCH
jgi:copper chaperone